MTWEVRDMHGTCRTRVLIGDEIFSKLAGNFFCDGVAAAKVPP